MQVAEGCAIQIYSFWKSELTARPGSRAEYNVAVTVAVLMNMTLALLYFKFIDINSHHHDFQKYQSLIAAMLLQYYKLASYNSQSLQFIQPAWKGIAR